MPTVTLENLSVPIRQWSCYVSVLDAHLKVLCWLVHKSSGIATSVPHLALVLGETAEIFFLVDHRCPWWCSSEGALPAHWCYSMTFILHHLTAVLPPPTLSLLWLSEASKQSILPQMSELSDFCASESPVKNLTCSHTWPMQMSSGANRGECHHAETITIFKRTYHLTLKWDSSPPTCPGANGVHEALLIIVESWKQPHGQRHNDFHEGP